MENQEIEQAHTEYHALVSAIQIDCQAEKEKTRQENSMECDRYIETHLEEPAGEITEKFALMLDADILKLRQEAAMLIDLEKTNLQNKIASILRHS